MKKRLFIAIPIPEEIKNEIILYKKEKKLKKLNLKWQARENLHITILFLGWQDENKIDSIISAIQKSLFGFKPFLIELNLICLGPKRENPRLIWIQGKKNLEIENLRNKLIRNLENQNIFFQKEKRSFQIHITIARARGRELYGVFFQKEIFIPFSAQKIVLFESILKKTGAEYKIIKSFILN